MYAQQEQRDQQEEQKAKPAQLEEKHAQQDEKKALQEKSGKQEEKTAQQQDKNSKQEEKTAQQQDKNAKAEEHNAQQHTQEARSEEQARHSDVVVRGRIPEDRFRANFGREHVFVINRPVIVEGHPRFQYGGYWFGFGQPWPGDWAYTDDVYVDYVDGGYYLYNRVHPGIRISINIF